MTEKKSFFVIGDSISIGYGLYLEKMVKDVFNCVSGRRNRQPIENSESPVGVYGGDSNMTLKYLEDQSKEIKNYDILLFNFGLHDIRTNTETQKRQVDIQGYEKNLNA